MSLTLKLRSYRSQEDIKDIYKKMSGVERHWYLVFLRGTQDARRPVLRAICPDEITFIKVWPEVVYESHFNQRNTLSAATQRHSRFRINDYLNHIAPGEKEVMEYLLVKYDGINPYETDEDGNNLKLSASCWTKARQCLDPHYDKPFIEQSLKRQREVTAPANDSAAKDFYTYIEGLLERNRRIIERGEAVWQKSADELEALIKQQQEDAEKTNTNQNLLHDQGAI